MMMMVEVLGGALSDCTWRRMSTILCWYSRACLSFLKSSNVWKHEGIPSSATFPPPQPGDVELEMNRHHCQDVEELPGVKVQQSADEGEDLLLVRGVGRVKSDQELKHLPHAHTQKRFTVNCDTFQVHSPVPKSCLLT